MKKADLMENVKVEPWSHKAKVAGFAALTFVVAGGYNAYFQNLMFRSAQHQEAAFAGQLSFNLPVSTEDEQYWNDLNQLSVWEGKGISELKRITMDWKT